MQTVLLEVDPRDKCTQTLDVYRREHVPVMLRSGCAISAIDYALRSWGPHVHSTNPFGRSYVQGGASQEMGSCSCR